MADIVRDRDEWGERLVWWVEWETNDGDFRERYFKSRRQAERFALEIEKELLVEAVAKFTGDRIGCRRSAASQRGDRN